MDSITVLALLSIMKAGDLHTFAKFNKMKSKKVRSACEWLVVDPSSSFAEDMLFEEDTIRVGSHTMKLDGEMKMEPFFRRNYLCLSRVDDFVFRKHIIPSAKYLCEPVEEITIDTDYVESYPPAPVSEEHYGRIVECCPKLRKITLDGNSETLLWVILSNLRPIENPSEGQKFELILETSMLMNEMMMEKLVEKIGNTPLSITFNTTNEDAEVMNNADAFAHLFKICKGPVQVVYCNFHDVNLLHITDRMHEIYPEIELEAVNNWTTSFNLRRPDGLDRILIIPHQ